LDVIRIKFSNFFFKPIDVHEAPSKPAFIPRNGGEKCAEICKIFV